MDIAQTGYLDAGDGREETSQMAQGEAESRYMVPNLRQVLQTLLFMLLSEQQVWTSWLSFASAPGMMIEMQAWAQTDCRMRISPSSTRNQACSPWQTQVYLAEST